MVSLNELRFPCPAAFAKFTLSATVPSEIRVEPCQLVRIEAVLGTRLRIVQLQVP
jgi:hypothetical protein